MTLVAALAFGVFAGVTAGLLGIGGGTVIVPFLVLALGLTQHEAEATSLLVVLPTAMFATWTLRRSGIARVGLSLRIGVLGAGGAVAGALLALVIPSEQLRIVFAAFLAVVGVRLLLGGIVAERNVVRVQTNDRGE